MELLVDTLTAHPSHLPPFSIRIISSIKTSSPILSVYFVLYFYCKRIRCMQRKNLEMGNVKRRRKCLAQQKAKHMTPKRNEKRTQNPPKKKKTQIEMHMKILNSIQFDSICKCCLTFAVSSSAFFKVRNDT